MISIETSDFPPQTGAKKGSPKMHRKINSNNHLIVKKKYKT